MFIFVMCSAIIVTGFSVYGQPCDENCLSPDCKPNYCGECIDGFFPNFGKCILCVINNCTKCFSRTYCQECEERYYKFETSSFSNSECRPCPGNCSTCNSTTSCSQCKPGYYGNICSYDCHLCHNGLCGKNYCTHGCKEGYFEFNAIDTGICFNCTKFDENCLTCSNIPTCTRCKESFILSEITGRCVKCDEDIVKCYRCPDGKWGVYCSNDCFNCVEKSCGRHSGECTHNCTVGYFKGPDRRCELCPSECNMNTCDMKNGSCLQGCKGNKAGPMCSAFCAGRCKTCNQYNEIICKDCYPGYHGTYCNQTCSNCANIETTSGLTHSNSVTTSELITTAKSSTLVATISTKAPSQDHQPVKIDPPIGAIAGGAGGAVVVIVIVIVVICLVLRRRKQPKNSDSTQYDNCIERDTLANDNSQGAIYAVPNKLKKNNSIPMKALNSNYDNVVPMIPSRLSHLDGNETDVDAIDIEDIEEEIDDESIDIMTEIEIVDPKADTYYNVAGLKRSRILCHNLPEYLEKKTKLDFDQEFQKFPKGLTRPYIEARKKENLGKNRYRGIYPYDATRVILRNGHSDFINANYIDGNNQEKAYIAALGPITATVPLFWEMVWQEKAETIVMLTNLVEGEKMKCEQYWPNVKQNEKYGEVNVLCETEDVFADFVIKRFSVSKNTEKRQVHHMHFTAWPDKSVPDDVTCLLEFREKVEQIPSALHGPIVVHCSAGIGRTGTYIGIDMLTKEGKSEGSVDIFGCVMGMRGQRVNMVQTVEQYQYIHDVVLHAVTFNCDAIPAKTFMEDVSTGTDSSLLQQEYQKLVSCDERKSEEETNAIERNRKHKYRNRKGADIPGDTHRILLKNKTPQQSDYINAVFLNSYKVTNRYIVAQTPLPGTVEDFLNLIVQEGVACIVTMDEENIKDKSVGVYLPAANQVLKKGSYQICSTMCESTSSYILRKVTITDQNQDGFETRTVYHFQFNSWKQNQTCPNDQEEMLELVKDTHRTASESESTGPILVHCLMGADRSGLFCVVSMLIQKMEVDQAASVVNTVRQIRTRRPGAISSLDQYAFCHQCVSTFVKSGSNYANV